MAHRPWVNYAIIAVNVALYAMGYNGAYRYIAPWLLDPNAMQLSQFFSCMFLHANWMHLLGNMLFLWVFGNAVNDRLGQLGYLMFYLAGGVLAGVGYVLLGGGAPVLGASGAIAAVTGAYLVLLPRARVTILALLVWVFMPFEVSSLYFILIQFVFNLWMSLSPALSGKAAGGVAYAAHSSGYLFGIVVAMVLLAIKALPRDPFDMLNLLRTWQRRNRYRQVVAQGYDPFSFVKPGMRQQSSQWVNARAAVADAPDATRTREFDLRRDIGEDLAHNDQAAAADKYLQLVQIADDTVLPQQQQLDVANQLMSSERYPAAADAYERFLKHYVPGYEYPGDIYLMLGLIYSRYLHQYDRARVLLQSAIDKLADPRKIELARADLQALGKKQ